MVTAALVVSSAAGMILSVPTGAFAKNSNSGHQGKVTICHRTNSSSNPYNQQTVNVSAVDGEGGGDHYTNHRGPVWSPSLAQGVKWGDIIPPIPGVHAGRNWTVRGRAIWRAGCQAPELPTLPERPDVPIIVLPPGSGGSGGSGGGSGGGSNGGSGGGVAGGGGWTDLIPDVSSPGDKLVRVWCTRHGVERPGRCKGRIVGKKIEVKAVCATGLALHVRITFSKPGYSSSVWDGSWIVSGNSRSLTSRGDAC